MPIERRNVPGLAAPPGYTHLATVGDARLVFIAGQVPLAGVWRALLDSELSAVVRTPATLLGVRHLGYDGQLVEVECTAAVPVGPIGQEPG